MIDSKVLEQLIRVQADAGRTDPMKLAGACADKNKPRRRSRRAFETYRSDKTAAQNRIPNIVTESHMRNVTLAG